jgi:hypothetical protein
LPSIAITNRPATRTARVHSHAPSTASSRSASIAANDRDPAITAAIPTASSPGQPMPTPTLVTRIWDLDEQIEQVLAAGSRHRRRCHRRVGSS